MEKIYFKGLEDVLNNNCYIKVHNCSTKYPVVEVKRKNITTGEDELICSAPNGNVLSALDSASTKLNIRENNPIFYNKTPIDDVITLGFNLQIFKLANHQIISLICSGNGDKCIPIKSVFSNDIKTGIDLLNKTLESYDFLFNEKEFFEYVDNQTKSIIEHKQLLLKK